MGKKETNGSSTKYIGISLIITFLFFLIELFGGFLTNSLALLTDAWHMLGDIFALFLSFIAAKIATRPESSSKTYGYYRAEVLAAFVQGIFLWILVFYMFYEGLHRLQEPSEVLSFNMLLIAILGLAANGLSALVLSQSHEENLNLKGAFLHVMTDTLGSIGAILAGLVMVFTGWYPVDSLIGMSIGVMILYSSGKVIRESANVLLEGVPSHIRYDDIERRIIEINGIRGIHDLHVWCITPSKMCLMSGHVVVEKGVDKKQLMILMIQILKEDFGIEHTTIQLEDEGYPVALGEHNDTFLKNT